MSTTAPWLALAADWSDSPMFDDLEKAMHPGHQLRDSVRLAWVCLLCECKRLGRQGTVSVRPARFAQRYGIAGGVEAVEIMLDCAEADAAVERSGDEVTLLGWVTYQRATPVSSSNAQRWLSDLLAKGRIDARDVRAYADQVGIPWRSVQSAKKALSVTSTREGFGTSGRWVWELGPAKGAIERQRAHRAPVPSTVRTSPEECTSEPGGGTGGGADLPADAGTSALPFDDVSMDGSDGEPALAVSMRATWTRSPREAATRLLRAIEEVRATRVSRKRLPVVLRALQQVAVHRDPLSLVRKIEGRSRGLDNPGGYVAQAIILEASKVESKTA